MHYEDENLQLAITKFESMLKSNKILFFDSEEFEDIVLYYLDSGKINLSKKALKIGLEQHPNSINLKLVKVEILVFEDKFDQAETLLNELRDIDPTNDEVYIQFANVNSKKGLHHEAIQCLYIALKHTDDEADVYSLLGMEYLYLENFEKAKEYFSLCVEMDSLDHSSLYNIIYCFECLQQTTEAITYLQNFLDTNPYSEIAWHQLGKLFRNNKEYDKAINALEFALAIDENFEGALIELGKNYEYLGNFTKALKYYEEALQKDSYSAYILWRIGACYENLNKDLLAKQYFQKVVEEDKLFDKAWISLTDLHIKHSEFQMALFYIKKAIEIDENNQLYWRRYATINHSLGNLNAAELGYRKAIENGDKFIDTWLYLADVNLHLKLYDQAIKCLLNLMDFHPEDFRISYRLAGLYFLTNEFEKATYHLTNALIENFAYADWFLNHFPELQDSELVLNQISNHKNSL